MKPKATGQGAWRCRLRHGLRRSSARRTHAHAELIELSPASSAGRSEATWCGDFGPFDETAEASQFSPSDVFELLGERAGTRTRDPLIKSQMLYQLSYALARKPLGTAGRSSVIVTTALGAYPSPRPVNPARPDIPLADQSHKGEERDEAAERAGRDPALIESSARSARRGPASAALPPLSRLTPNGRMANGRSTRW